MSNKECDSAFCCPKIACGNCIVHGSILVLPNVVRLLQLVWRNFDLWHCARNSTPFFFWSTGQCIVCVPGYQAVQWPINGPPVAHFSHFHYFLYFLTSENFSGVICELVGPAFNFSLLFQSFSALKVSVYFLFPFLFSAKVLVAKELGMHASIYFILGILQIYVFILIIHAMTLLGKYFLFTCLGIYTTRLYVFTCTCVIMFMLICVKEI